MTEIVNHIHDMKRGVDFIGVGVVFICHDGKGNVLLHKRSNKCRDEHGRWDCGAGAVEFGEDLEQAVRREVKEEYHTDAKEIKFMNHVNVLRKNGETPTHWLSMRYSVLVDPKNVANGDPEKIDQIGWFKQENFPAPLHSIFAQTLDLVDKVLKEAEKHS